MPRYIDAEHLMEKLSKMIDYCEKNKDKKFNVLNTLFQVGDAIMNCPTEDVVPRSEIEKAKQETFDEAIEKIENIMDLVAQYYRDNEGDEGRQLEYQAQHLGLNKARYILLDLKKKYIGE
jgi:CRISPR/Cas system CSM-associated protein Csm2 small subunit